MRDQHILPNGRSTEGAFQESRPHSKDVSDQNRLAQGFADLMPQKPDRASNPMSFASILGPSHHEPTSKVADGKPSRPATPPPAKSVLESKPVPEEPLVAKLPDLGQPRHVLNGEAKLQSRADSLHFQRKIVAPSKPRTILTEREAEKILKALSSIEEGPLSDVEDGGLLEQKGRYKQRSRKRAADVAESELHKRKVSESSLKAPPFTLPYYAR